MISTFAKTYLRWALMLNAVSITLAVLSFALVFFGGYRQDWAALGDRTISCAHISDLAGTLALNVAMYAFLFIVHVSWIVLVSTVLPPVILELGARKRRCMHAAAEGKPDAKG